VARDAEPHLIHLIDLEHLGHALHISMARSTCIGPHRLDVALVREVSMPGQIVDPHPLHRLLLRPRLAQLPDFGLVRAVAAGDDEVTPHAGLHRRYTRLGRDVNRIVTVLTLHLVLAGMDVVAKENRLARTLEVAAIGGREMWSSDGIGDCAGLLRVRRNSAEGEEGGNASGRNATDDVCQLTHSSSHR